MKLDTAQMLLDLADRIPDYHRRVATVLARDLIADRYGDLRYGVEIRLSDAGKRVARGWCRINVYSPVYEHGIAIDIRRSVLPQIPGRMCYHIDNVLWNARLHCDQHRMGGYCAGSY